MSNPTVLILGGSYAGIRALEVLAKKLPARYSAILIERNSHFNHIYTFPRNGVISGHAQKAFVPYTEILNKATTPDPDKLSLLSSPAGTSSSSTSHRIIQATVTKIEQGFVQLDRFVDITVSNQLVSPSSVYSDDEIKPVSGPDDESSYGTFSEEKNLGFDGSIDNFIGSNFKVKTDKIHWDYLIYALGSDLPLPLTLPKSIERTKLAGVYFLKSQQQAILKAKKIIIVGGGALGIQYATDIAQSYSDKQVTLIHSRPTFLPLFSPTLDIGVKKALSDLKIRTVLSERVNLEKLQVLSEDQKPIRVESLKDSERYWEADLVLLCTGQVPNTSLMAEFDPSAVQSKGYISVNRALQVSQSQLEPSPTSRVFAIGDCIDGFGAIKNGHAGVDQAEVAVHNILKMIESGSETEMTRYEPRPPGIKLSLGLDRTIINFPTGEVKEIRSEIGDDESAWKLMWLKLGHKEDVLANGWA